MHINMNSLSLYIYNIERERERERDVLVGGKPGQEKKVSTPGAAPAANPRSTLPNSQSESGEISGFRDAVMRDSMGRVCRLVEEHSVSLILDRCSRWQLSWWKVAVATTDFRSFNLEKWARRCPCPRGLPYTPFPTQGFPSLGPAPANLPRGAGANIPWI